MDIKNIRCYLTGGHEFKKISFKDAFVIPVFDYETNAFIVRHYFGFIHKGKFSKCEKCGKETTDNKILESINK